MYNKVYSSNKGMEGVVLTGLYIEGQELFYEINDLKLPCGQINFFDMALQ